MPLASSSRVLRERWRAFLIVFAIVVLAAVATTVLTPKTYTATAQVFVTARAGGDASTRAQANNYVQTQVPSYAKVIDSPDVVSYVRAHLGSAISSSTIRDELAASSDVSSSIIDVVATDRSAARSAQLANAAAQGFVAAIESYDSSAQLFLTGPAQQPSTPTSPRPSLDIAVGVILAIVLGAAAAGARAAFDPRLRTPDAAAAAAQASLFAVVPNDSGATRFPVAAAGPEPSARAAAFRQLRTSVLRASGEHGKVIAVASPVEGDGKTSVALNLAGSLAEAGYRVCLVDAALTHPSLAPLLGVAESPGLSDVLRNRIDPHSALQDFGNGLQVLTTGSVVERSGGLLASAAAAPMLQTLAASVDFLVVDSAPLLVGADGSQIASLAGSVLLVTSARGTRRADVVRARDALGQVDAAVIGVVFNRAPRRRGSERRGYGYRSDQPFSTSSPAGRHASIRDIAATSNAHNDSGGNAS